MRNTPGAVRAGTLGAVRLIVVGAGVVGLTCAVRLLEAGHRVDVLARDLPRETTSVVAAAIWYPYRAWPRERVGAWSARTLDVLRELAAHQVPGVRLVPGTEVLARAHPEDPWWSAGGPRLTRLADPPPGYLDGWRFTAPVVEMPVYLTWLHERVVALGGTLTRVSLGALPAPPEGAMVVDCAGLGARLLAGDTTVVPVRGQVVRLEQWGLREWWLDGDGPTYVVPREHDVVVGGTAEEGEWSRTPSRRTAADILGRASRLVPEVTGARVLQHAVGLRPARPAVRVERLGRVVHCYGHGGAGVTLSWGCAEEVVSLVEAGRAGAHGDPPSR